MKKVHFITGLPRSGTTLLGAILRQNPRFHAAMTSPVGTLYLAMQSMLSGKTEFHPFFTDVKRTNLLRGIFENYYDDVTDREVIFDTNRVWAGKITGLLQLYPDSRFIVCVRPVVWIIDSIERIVRANPLEPSRIFGYEAGGSAYSRADQLLGSAGLVGAALASVREAFYGPYADRILMINYDTLVRRPVETLGEIYHFLGQPPGVHNFDDVQYEADDYDIRLGAKGLHRVSRRVEFVPREFEIPLDLIDRCTGMDFWLAERNNIRRVKIV